MFLTHLTTELLQNPVNYALAPLVIPLVMMGIQVAGSIIKGVKANKQKKAAEEAINNYKRQKLKNVYEGTSYYNAEARELAMKGINDKFGTTVSAAGQGGARTMGVAVQAQEVASNAILKQAAFEKEAYIEHQDKLAQGEADVQVLQEQRERDDISGLSSLYAAGVEGEQAAITEGLTGAATIAGGMVGTGGAKSGSTIDAGGYTPRSTINPVNSQSITKVQIDNPLPPPLKRN